MLLHADKSPLPWTHHLHPWHRNEPSKSRSSNRLAYTHHPETTQRTTGNNRILPPFYQRLRFNRTPTDETTQERYQIPMGQRLRKSKEATHDSTHLSTNPSTTGLQQEV